MKLLMGLMAVAVSIAVPASAQMREAPIGDVFASYNDCFAVTETGSISTSKLTELGWAKASTTTKDGETIADGPIIYGRGDRAPIIMLTATQGDGACIVMARLESMKTFETFKEAFGGKLPKADKDGAITFMAQGHPVQIAPTGSPEKPSMRLLVATPTESK